MEVTGSDVLLTTAELALALAGFGSVVSAFVGNRRQWQPMEVVRLRALIMISLSSALIALIPFPLAYGVLEEPALWVVSSSLAALIAGAVLVGMLIAAQDAMMQEGSRPWSILAISFAVATIVINMLNALGIGFQKSFSGYFTALLIMLVLAGLYFARLIVVSGPRARESVPDQAE
jgi:hypothetical protein